MFFELGETSASNNFSTMELAKWAGYRYGIYTREAVVEIVTSVTKKAESLVEILAQETVAETKMGNSVDKASINTLFSRGVFQQYQGLNLVDRVYSSDFKSLRIPRPAGVVFGFVSVGNPVASIFMNVISSLISRNAIVIVIPPSVAAVCNHAIEELSEAASEARAPIGVISALYGDEGLGQVFEPQFEPRNFIRGIHQLNGASLDLEVCSIPRSYSIVPVVVDSCVDPKIASATIIASKALDNSLMPTCETVMIILDEIADILLSEMQRDGAYLLNESQCNLVREQVFGSESLDGLFRGRDAVTIANQLGIVVPPLTRVLLAPIGTAFSDEVLLYDVDVPILSFVRVGDFQTAISTARLLCVNSQESSFASLHSNNPSHIDEFAAEVPATRIAINVGSSLGNAGILPHELNDQFGDGVELDPFSLLGSFGPQSLVAWSESFLGLSPLGLQENLSLLKKDTAIYDRVPKYPLEQTIVPTPRT